MRISHGMLDDDSVMILPCASVARVMSSPCDINNVEELDEAIISGLNGKPTGGRGLDCFAHPLIRVAPFFIRGHLGHGDVVGRRGQHSRARVMHRVVIRRAVGDLSRWWAAHGSCYGVGRRKAVGAPVLPRTPVRSGPRSCGLRVRVHAGHVMVSTKVRVLWRGDEILGRKVDTRSPYRSLVVIHVSFAFIQKVSNIHVSQGEKRPESCSFFLRRHPSNVSC